MKHFEIHTICVSSMHTFKFSRPLQDSYYSTYKETFQSQVNKATDV